MGQGAAHARVMTPSDPLMVYDSRIRFDGRGFPGFPGVGDMAGGDGRTDGWIGRRRDSDEVELR